MVKGKLYFVSDISIADAIANGIIMKYQILADVGHMLIDESNIIWHFEFIIDVNHIHSKQGFK
jgi:hypothetical protein